MAVFQPAEETAEGSKAMLDDGMMDRFPRPDVILGQHLLQYRAGTVRRTAEDPAHRREVDRSSPGVCPSAADRQPLGERSG